jgi:TonB family protein
MKWLCVAALVLAAGFFGWPLLNEGSGSTCSALEDLAARQLMSQMSADRTMASEALEWVDLIANGVTVLSQGKIAVKAVKRTYPYIPPFAGCALLYYRHIANPSLAWSTPPMIPPTVAIREPSSASAAPPAPKQATPLIDDENVSNPQRAIAALGRPPQNSTVPPPEKPEPPQPKPMQTAQLAPQRVEEPPHRAKYPGPTATRNEYLAYVHSLIRQHYNLLPLSMVGGRRGETLVEFIVLDDGTIAMIRVRQSSGYPDIDERVEQMVAAVRRVPPLPQWFQRPSMGLILSLPFPDALRE